MWRVWKGDKSNGAYGLAFGLALFSYHDVAICVLLLGLGGRIDRSIDNLRSISVCNLGDGRLAYPMACSRIVWVEFILLRHVLLSNKNLLSYLHSI